MVGIKAVAEGLREVVVDGHTSVVQAPDLDWVEPKVRFRVSTVGVDIVSVPAAVAAEVNCVEIFHAQGLLGSFEGSAQDSGITTAKVTDEIRRRGQCQVR